MKLKRLLAGLTAAATAAMVLTVLPVTSAAAATPFGSATGEWAQADFFSNSSPEMSGVDLSSATSVVFNANAIDLNWGWNNGQFYADGSEWLKKSFGGTESDKQNKLDVVLENAGEFSVELDFSIKSDNTYALGWGTGCSEGAFELNSIDIYAGSSKLGSWVDSTWYAGEEYVPPAPEIVTEFGSDDGNWAQEAFLSDTSPEMSGVDLGSATSAIFYAKASDLNYGWNNGQFYADGSTWQSRSFGGTESDKQSKLDVVLESAGEFSVTLDFSVKSDKTYALGWGTGTKKGAFALRYIEISAKDTLLGTWKNGTWTSAVTEVAPTGITLDKKELSLTIIDNAEAQLTASVAPEDAAYEKDDITWKSSDEKIAAVDKNGKVTAVGAGTAEITVSLGDFSDTCSVTVKKKPLALILVSPENTDFVVYKDTDEARRDLIFEKISVSAVDPDDHSKTVDISKNDYTLDIAVNGTKVTVTPALTESGKTKYELIDVSPKTFDILYEEWIPTTYIDYTVSPDTAELENGLSRSELETALQDSVINLISADEEHAPLPAVPFSRAGVVKTVDDSAVKYDTAGTYTVKVTLDLTKIMNEGDTYIVPVPGASGSGFTELTVEIKVTVKEKAQEPTPDEPANPDEPVPDEPTDPDEPVTPPASSGWKEQNGVYTYTHGDTASNGENLTIPTNGQDLSGIKSISVKVKTSGYAKVVMGGALGDAWTTTGEAEISGDTMTVVFDVNGQLTSDPEFQIWWIESNVTVEVSEITFTLMSSDTPSQDPSSPSDDDDTDSYDYYVSPMGRIGEGTAPTIWNTNTNGKAPSAAQAAAAIRSAKSGDTVTVVMTGRKDLPASVINALSSKKNVTVDIVYSGYTISINSDDIDADKISALNFRNGGRFLTKEDLEVLNKDVVQIDLSDTSFDGISKITVKAVLRSSAKGKTAQAYKYDAPLTYNIIADDLTAGDDRTVTFEVTEAGRYFVNIGEPQFEYSEAEDISAAAGVQTDTADSGNGYAAVILIAAAAVFAVRKARA